VQKIYPSVLIELLAGYLDGATLISWGMYDKTIAKDLIRNDLEYLLEQTEDHSV
jgi:hypothetical protein